MWHFQCRSIASKKKDHMTWFKIDKTQNFVGNNDCCYQWQDVKYTGSDFLSQVNVSKITSICSMRLIKFWCNIKI